jgi:hypothetical protein
MSPRMTYRGAMHMTHPELGPLEPGKTYEVTREQAKWLSPEAGWAPEGKARETKAKLEQQAEKDAASADQAADVPGNPDVTGDH